MVTRPAVAKAWELTVPALASPTPLPVLKAVLPGPSGLVLSPGVPTGAWSRSTRPGIHPHVGLPGRPAPVPQTHHRGASVPPALMRGPAALQGGV